MTKTQREKHLAKVAELDSQHWSQNEIAVALGVTRQQVGYDLKALTQRYQAEQRGSQKAKLARKRERLRLQRKGLLAQWGKSKRAEYQRLILENEKEDSKLDGLYPPTKIAPTKPDGSALDSPHEPLSDAEIIAGMRELESIVEAARARKRAAEGLAPAAVSDSSSMANTEDHLT